MPTECTAPAPKLGVNIDHVATLRQARGTHYPAPIEAAHLCAAAGADGITVHLREDRRHIQEYDVRKLKAEATLPLNLEMACVDEVLHIALDVRPHEVCLVPEKRQELTTEGGLDVCGQRSDVFHTVQALRDAGIIVSLFVEADPRQLDCCAESGAEYVELHTGTFCDAPAERQTAELMRLIEGARHAQACGLRVNAGHGIHLGNVAAILRIPALDTLNIGHSIVSRAVMIGMQEAVREMRMALRGGDTVHETRSHVL